MTSRVGTRVGSLVGTRVGSPANDYITEFIGLSPYAGFRGDSYVQSGTEAQSLVDLSGNARHATQADNTRWATLVASSPNFAGRPTFLFGSGDCYDTSSYALGPFTVALVAKLTTDSAMYWGHSSNDTYAFKTSGKLRSARTVAVSSIRDAPAVDTSARLYMITCGPNNADNTQRWNAVDQTMTNVTSNNPGSGTQSGVTRVNGGANNFTLSKISEIAELWVFPQLSAANVSIVETRLMSRYGF